MEKRTVWVVGGIAVSLFLIACCCVGALVALSFVGPRAPLAAQIAALPALPEARAGLRVPTIPLPLRAPTPLGGRRENGTRANVEREQQLGNVHSVDLQVAADLTIVLGSPSSLQIWGESRVVDQIQVLERDGRLVLSMRPGSTTVGDDSVYITLTTPSLRAIAVMGSGDVLAPDLTAQRLSLSVSGSGDITTGRIEADQVEISLLGSGDITALGMAAERLSVTVSGSGSAQIGAGEVASQEVTLTGSGDYDGQRLASARTTALLRGSGSATVQASEELLVELFGSGDLEYIGSPRVSGSSFGSGEIYQIRP